MAICVPTIARESGLARAVGLGITPSAAKDYAHGLPALKINIAGQIQPDSRSAIY
jgi:hypothetical protein